MRSISFLIILIFVSRCNEAKVKFTAYEFKLESFEWDLNPYKFSSYIQDSVLHSNGSQMAAWEYSYIGDLENTYKMWDDQAQIIGELSQAQKDSFLLFKRRDATEYILEQAKAHKVVIINEGHHEPQHRVFTTQLLDGLKEQGFKHFGLETYYARPQSDSILQSNGGPTLKSGYYTKEPQFGNLVRVAHKKGFKIFGYETQGGENGKEREINQAKNIKAYMEKYPNEKILIHCGFAHGYEGELNSSWEKAMAGRLTEYTSINPLTINQVIYSERGKKEYENPYYQLTDLDKPSVYINKNGKVFGEYKEGSWFDIAVFHPRSGTFNRPKWMQYGDRKEVDLSLEETDIDCPCLVFAYKKGEEIGKAIPYDIQETNTKKVKLILDKSDFEIIIWNQAGRALKSELVNK